MYLADICNLDIVEYDNFLSGFLPERDYVMFKYLLLQICLSVHPTQPVEIFAMFLRHCTLAGTVPHPAYPTSSLSPKMFQLRMLKFCRQVYKFKFDVFF